MHVWPAADEGSSEGSCQLWRWYFIQKKHWTVNFASNVSPSIWNMSMQLCGSLTSQQTPMPVCWLVGCLSISCSICHNFLEGAGKLHFHASIGALFDNRALSLAIFFINALTIYTGGSKIIGLSWVHFDILHMDHRLRATMSEQPFTCRVKMGDMKNFHSLTDKIKVKLFFPLYRLWLYLEKLRRIEPSL